MLTGAPGEADPGWEVVEESSIVSAGEIAVRELGGTPADGVSAVEPGRYHVRASARGRDVATSMGVSEPTEEYLFELWPVVAEPAGEPVVVTVRKTDQAWSPSVPTDLADPTDSSDAAAVTPDFSVIYVRDEGGVVRTVSPDSELGQAAIRVVKERGGRPLDGALTGQVYAMQVAYLDRPLVDWLAEQDEATLGEFKAECVRAAFRRAGLDRYPWVYEHAQRAIDDRRLDEATSGDLILDVRDDPSIERRLVPGLPGCSESVEQLAAVDALRGFFDPNPQGALFQALETYMHSLTAFGIEAYPELLRLLHERFSIPSA